MTFNDIFKSSFLEGVTSVSIVDSVIALLMAFLIGLVVFFVRKTYRRLFKKHLAEALDLLAEREDARELAEGVLAAAEDTGFVNRLAKMPGITNAVLVSYNGDYMG